jgi:hypothetical protein
LPFSIRLSGDFSKQSASNFTIVLLPFSISLSGDFSKQSRSNFFLVPLTPFFLWWLYFIMIMCLPYKAHQLSRSWVRLFEQSSVQSKQSSVSLTHVHYQEWIGLCLNRNYFISSSLSIRSRRSS